MAFTATMTKKRQLPGGDVLEEYTWTATAGDTTGTITADTTLQPEIQRIDRYNASSDSDNAALVCATDVNLNQLKLTFVANDTGEAYIIGKAA